MKNIKKLAFILTAFLLFSSLFCITTFAEESQLYVVDTSTVYAEIPEDFYFFPFIDSFNFTNDKNDNIQIFQADNFNIENGVKRLTREKAFDIYKYYFNIDTDYYEYKINEGKVEKINGISAYIISGDMISEYTECDELDDESGNIVPGESCYQYFVVCIFATRENTIIVSYESGGEKTKEHVEKAEKLIKSVLINGTYFDNEKLSVSHNFMNSPAFEDALQTATDNFNPTDHMDTGFIKSTVAIFFLLFCGPVIVFIIVAIINIVNYSKNKKKLKRYELTYGSIPKYNAYPKNYNGYGYNQPVNQPYQPPVNPVYQQTPVNQNVQQTPGYVTTAVENLGAQFNQSQKPEDVTEPEIQNNESAGE